MGKTGVWEFGARLPESPGAVPFMELGAKSSEKTGVCGRAPIS